MKWFEDFFKKNEDGSANKIWYIVILLCIGVILFMFANKNITESEVEQTSPVMDTVQTAKTLSYEERLENRLEEAFSKMAGVGKVEVTLTIASSKEVILNKDTITDNSTLVEQDSNGGNRSSEDANFNEKTILTSGNDGSQEPIVLKETMPMVQGVMILALNGDDPTVQADLTKAAETLLNVPAHKVNVFKMN